MKMEKGETITAEVSTLAVELEKNAAGLVQVDITADVIPALLDKIKNLGGEIVYSSARFNSITAKLPLGVLEQLAASDAVRSILPWLPPVHNSWRTNGMDNYKKNYVVDYKREPVNYLNKDVSIKKINWQRDFITREDIVRKKINAFLNQDQTDRKTDFIGSVTSEADVTHKAALARSVFGINGAGVKIGVISDGVGGMATSQASGDLPAVVTVLPGQAGTGSEGTAMLELIHDLAPGAQLYFATAVTSQTSFAQNILDLRAAGCDIIVDDISYLREAVFQDDNVSQAVNTVTASGALYFSSAGNSGNKNDNTSGAWEGDFFDAGTGTVGTVVLPGGTVHDFGGGTLSNIITATATPFLKWSDPLLTSANDYDLFILDNAATTVLASSTNIQDGIGGNDNPLEFVGSQAVGRRIVIFKKTAAAVRGLHLNTNRGRITVNTSGVVFGHNAAGSAYSVAATPAIAPGPFPGVFTAANSVETFSSDGPRRMFYNPNGSPITPGNFLFGTAGGTLLQKPDITAADGTVTTTPGFNPFYGTSAAAPHAAAIAALIKSKLPALTPAQIRTALISSAIDIETPGTDRDAGAGIIMAYEALLAAGAVINSSDISLGTVTAIEGTYSNTNGFIEPGELASMTVQLNNTSATTATSVTAVLTTSTPGVTITQGSANYGNIVGAGNATNTGTPYLFGINSSVPCGTVINFILTVTYGGGGASPKPLNFTVTTGALIVSISETIGVAPAPSPDYTAVSGQQTGRINRFLPPSSCALPKVNPGLFVASGSREYHAYTFTNTTGINQCVAVTMNSAGGSNLFTVVYNNSGFVPATPNSNYLADQGNSLTANSFSFTAPAGQSFTMVVHEVNATITRTSTSGPVSIPYTLSVSLPYCEAPRACTTVVVSPVSIPAGATGTAYSQSFSATGGSGSYTFSLSGALPSGLSFSGNTLSGTTTASGTFPITVTATDITGCPIGTRNYNLVINCPVITVNAPTVTQPNCPAITGTIVINATGTGVLEYSVDGVTYQPSSTFSGLAQGVYYISARYIALPGCAMAYSANPVVISGTSSRVSTVLAGSSPFQDSLWTFKYPDLTPRVTKFGPTLAGFTITGMQGLATDPLTGQHYIIMRVSDVSGRVLGKIDLQTGVCTQVGNLGNSFSSITFRSDGQMFGVIGDGGGAGFIETLWTINKNTAAKTFAMALGNGADGEVICYNPDDNFIYHWSGNSTVIFEKIQSAPPYAITNIPIIGTTNGETFGAFYKGGNEFITTNISSSANKFTTTGVVTGPFSSFPDDLRGLVSKTCVTSITPACSASICTGGSLLLTANGGTGNYQWYKNAVLIPAETNSTYNATTSGVYNCIFTDQCNFTDSVAVGINVLISNLTLYTVTGGGAYCNNPGAIAYPIGLSGSQAGVNYQLFRGATPVGAPVPGTGGPISFGPQGVIGTYTVVANHATNGCTQPMTGSKAVSTISCDPVITDPCTCLNNATTLTNGQFGETVTVNGPAGQTWTVTAVTGLYTTASPAPPLAPNPILVGATMTEGPAGVYNLSGKHIDAIGYTITVNNGLGTSLSIGNTCEYPNPVITGIAPAICVNNTPITLTGTPGDANIVSQSFTINGAPATQFTPSIPGTYTIGYTVNGGVPKAFGLNDPGCTQTVTQSVSVITSVTGTILGNSNTTICAGQSSDINMDLSGAPNFTGVFNIAVQSGSGIATPVFNFTATTNGASSITIPTGNLTNTSSSPVTYRVTWISLSDLSGCPVSSLTGSATIIVYPLPTIAVTGIPTVDICPFSAFNITVTNPNAIPGAKYNLEIIGANTYYLLQNLNFGSFNISFADCGFINPVTMKFIPVGPSPLACTGTPLSFLVNVRDEIAPYLKNGAVLPANQTNVNACKANAPIAPAVTDIKALYTDNCTAEANLVVNQTVNTVTGDDCNWTATYTFTIKDACNNTTTVTITYTGKDLTPPGWNIPAGSLNRTVEYCDINATPGTNTLAAAQLLAPTGIDNCGGAVFVTKTSGVFATTTCATAGIITNTWTIKDACNNTSPIVFTQVITIVDTKGPAITGAIPQELNTGSSVNCSAILPNYILGTGGIAPNAVLAGITATDCASLSGLFPAPAAITYVNNTSGANRIWQSPAPGVSVGGFGGLIIPVTIFAQDACGNMSQVTFNVTAKDQTKPIVRCHPITVTLDAAGFASITPSMLDGNGSPFPAGTGTATAPLALSKDSCSAVNLTFTFINLPNATSLSRTFSCNDVLPNSQSTGIPVQIQGTDASGNFDVCTATVTVRENTPPVFTVCPATNTITLNKDAGCAVTLPDFRTAPWSGTFVATDICSPSVGAITYTQSPAPGSVFLGNITFVDVTMTATDAHTNTATCITRVILKDVTPPTFVGCPSSTPLKPTAGFIQAAVNSCSAVVFWNVPTLLDNCSVLGLPTISNVVATGTVQLPDLSAAIFKAQGTVNVSATFFVGTTTVTYTARDFEGNTSTCTFVVTLYDATAPVITCPGVLASPAINGSAVSVPMNSGCGWTRGTSTSWDATATDNCLLSNVTYNLTRTGLPLVSIGSGVSLANVVFTGVTVVTWSATDFSGNVSTCSFTVTVVDNTAPTIQCPPNVTASVNAPGCSALVPANLTNLVVPGTADNCAIILTEWDVSGATPVASGIGNIGAYTFASGVSTVQYRVRDAAGNIAVCSFTVTVGSGVTGTVNFPGGVQQVGLNNNPQPTVIFTGAGSASAPGTQQYMFTYSLSVNNGPAVVQPAVQTAVGSNVIALVQPNNVVSTFKYTLLTVTDGQACAGTVAAAPNNASTITVVIGTPSLALSVDMAPNQINAGGTIEEAIIVRNIGTVATAGLVTVNASVYSALTGLTVAQSAAAATINGTPYTPTAGWTFNALTGDFTSSNPIAAGGNSIIRIRITRGTGLLAGSAGKLNHTITLSGGNEPAAQANDGTNTVNLEISKN